MPLFCVNCTKHFIGRNHMNCQCFFASGCVRYEVGETLIEKNYTHNGVVVLKTGFSLPKVRTTGGCIDYQRINSYYANQAAILNNTAEMELYPAAVEDHELALRDDRPFNPHEFYTSFTKSLSSDKLLSLYIDTSLYQGGAHPNTERSSQTWAVRTGEIVKPHFLFEQNSRCKDIIQRQIQTSAEEMAEEGILLPDYEEFLDQNLDFNNYFLTCECLVIYYPLYTIALRKIQVNMTQLQQFSGQAAHV